MCLHYLFQLRVSLSPLRSHKFRYNFTDTPSEICHSNHGIEDTTHFLFSCPDYATPRAILTASVINILQKNNQFRFFSAVQDKPIVYKKRWYFRGSAFIHHSVDNFPMRFWRSTRVIHFISHVG